MKTTFLNDEIGNYIEEVSIRNSKLAVKDVYSVTSSYGFVKSIDYFEKEVFSDNLNNYKIVAPKQFAYNPSRINVGSIDYLNNITEVIVSPLYVVFSCKESILEDYLLKYLKSPSGNISIRSKTRGAVRDTLTFRNLSEIKIPIPSKNHQHWICEILNKIDSLITERKESLSEVEELSKSLFYKFFGDPIKNQKEWHTPKLKHFGEIITGNTPPRADEDNYSSNFIEWIKTDNIIETDTYVSKSSEHLSQVGAKKARILHPGALLVACITGSIDSIGRASLTDRKVSFNQQINAIQPNKQVSSTFLYWLFKCSQRYIQKHASVGMKNVLSKGDFEEIEMIMPPFDLQEKFSFSINKIESLRVELKNSLIELQTLYNSVSYKCFSGQIKDSELGALNSQIADNENSKVKLISVNSELVGPSDLKTSMLKNVTYKYFKKNTFSFSELSNKFQEANAETEFDYDKLKDQVFSSIKGNMDVKLKQVFDENKKRILLQVDR